MKPPEWLKSMFLKKPGMKLYRAMRPDLRDLKSQFEAGLHDASADADIVRVRALRAVALGSEERSPFYHASTTLQGARHWHFLGRQDRGEVAGDQLLVQLDVWDWFQYEELQGRGEFKEDWIIDLSTRQSQERFFSKHLSEYVNKDDAFAHRFEVEYEQQMRRALSCNEVLLKWRGLIPPECMTVVNPATGDVVAPLMAYAAVSLPRKVDSLFYSVNHDLLRGESISCRDKADRGSARLPRPTILVTPPGFQPSPSGTSAPPLLQAGVAWAPHEAACGSAYGSSSSDSCEPLQVEIAAARVRLAKRAGMSRTTIQQVCGEGNCQLRPLIEEAVNGQIKDDYTAQEMVNILDQIRQKAEEDRTRIQASRRTRVVVVLDTTRGSRLDPRLEQAKREAEYDPEGRSAAKFSRSGSGGPSIQPSSASGSGGPAVLPPAAPVLETELGMEEQSLGEQLELDYSPDGTPAPERVPESVPQAVHPPPCTQEALNEEAGRELVQTAATAPVDQTAIMDMWTVELVERECTMQRGLIARVRSLEKSYLGHYHSLVQRLARQEAVPFSWQPGYGCGIFAPDTRRGWCPFKQLQRRIRCNDLVGQGLFCEVQSEALELLQWLGDQLRNSLGGTRANVEEFKQHAPPGTLAEFSIQALNLAFAAQSEASSQDRPSTPEGHRPRYAKLLQDNRFIAVHPNHQHGSKPKASCVQEAELSESEKWCHYHWGHWWMKLGGFKDRGGGSNLQRKEGEEKTLSRL